MSERGGANNEIEAIPGRRNVVMMFQQTLLSAQSDDGRSEGTSCDIWKEKYGVGMKPQWKGPIQRSTGTRNMVTEYEFKQTMHSEGGNSKYGFRMLKSEDGDRRKVVG